MGEFFKGWRRKIGMVTLVMALVATAGCVRSSLIDDTIVLAFGSISWEVKSHNRVFEIIIHRSFGNTSVGRLGIERTRWRSDVRFTDKPTSRSLSPRNIEWRYQRKVESLGMMFASGEQQIYPNSPEHRATIKSHALAFPHIYAAVPLTTISLWLLVRKPRTSTQTKITEPVAIEVA